MKRNVMTQEEKDQLGRQLDELDEMAQDLEDNKGWDASVAPVHVSHKGTEMATWEQEEDPEAEILRELEELEELAEEAGADLPPVDLPPVTMGRTKLPDGNLPLDIRGEDSAFTGLNSEQHDRPRPEAAPLRQFIGALSTALSDAVGKAPADWMRPDWVTILTSRDWIRYSAFPYLKEVMGDANIRPATFQKKLKEWEVQWLSNDMSREPDDPVLVSEVQGNVPSSAVSPYLAELWIQVDKAEAKLSLAKGQLISLFSRVFDIVPAGVTADKLEVMTEVATILEESEEAVGKVPLSDIAAKIRRLHDLIEQRGLDSEEESFTQKSNQTDTDGGEA